MAWLLLFLLAGLGMVPELPAAQEAKPQSSLVEIRGIRLRKVGGQLNLHFLLSGPARHRIVANPTKRVLVVKFSNALPAFPNDKREFAFNDPFVEGVAFEQIGERESWAKIKLRSPHLVFHLVADPRKDRVIVGFKLAPAGDATVLTGIRLARRGKGSRLVLDLTGMPKIEGEQDGLLFQIRLIGVVPRLITPAQVKDRNVAVLETVARGRDTIVRVKTLKKGLQPKAKLFPGPPRLVIDFQPGAAKFGKSPFQPVQPAPPALPDTGDTPEGQLLKQWAKKGPLLEANYRRGLLEFERRRYRTAYRLFLQVFDAIPKEEFGVRALFRAADAQHELLVGIQANNFHGNISTYQSAIQFSVGQKRPKSDHIARALYKIGRAYQYMGFDFEANVHYEILQKDFPLNVPFTPISHYYQGLNFIRLNKPEKAIAALNKFLQSNSAPELEGPALFLLGDAYYNLKQYPQAMARFNLAVKLDPGFPTRRPELLFHMGETYYENADFEQARVFYRALLERHPNKSFSKLVGLRLGDFLREEGKENEAIAIYRQVIRNAPREVRLRGKLRIANLLGNRPEGRQLDEALRFFDEIIAEGKGTVVIQEALLRKGLTLTLHGRHQEAIDTFEKLAADYPAGPYTRDNLIKRNIEENLRAMISNLYAGKKYIFALRIYTKYQEKYFRDFRFPFSQFLIGRSYHQLGLYDEAIGLYDTVLKGGKAGPLASMLEIQKAHSLLEKDDLGAAETALLDFIIKRKKDVYRIDAQVLLGKVHFTQRRYQEARKSYQLILDEFQKTKDAKIGESLAEVHFELGQINKELGRTKDALDSYRKSVATF
ncbi:MAG: tetratricopeptide repeat protein, partial [bacterium]